MKTTEEGIVKPEKQRIVSYDTCVGQNIPNSSVMRLHVIFFQDATHSATDVTQTASIGRPRGSNIDSRRNWKLNWITDKLFIYAIFENLLTENLFFFFCCFLLFLFFFFQFRPQVPDKKCHSQNHIFLFLISLYSTTSFQLIARLVFLLVMAG